MENVESQFYKGQNTQHGHVDPRMPSLRSFLLTGERFLGLHHALLFHHSVKTTVGVNCTMNDLNNDGNIGDVITAVIGDNGSIGLYQTGSGSYLIDNSGLDIGDSSVSPTLLTQVVTARRGPATTSLYDFSNTPTGTVALTEGGFGIYYQTTGRNGADVETLDSFDTNGVFKQTDGYSFAQLLADETTYNIDLNKDGSVGDVIAEVVINNAAKPSSLYQTLSRTICP